MGSISSSFLNNIKTKKINQSDFNSFINYINNYLGNRVIANTNVCNSSQDTIVSLQCIQQAIQQTNIGNEIAMSIMQTIIQNIPNDDFVQIINNAENIMKQGDGGDMLNPFSSQSVEININLSNLSETQRKLSNLISNQVANNILLNNIQNIKLCFLTSAQQLANNIKNITGNDNPNIQSSQYLESFIRCRDLLDLTNRITTNILNILQIQIINDSIQIKNVDNQISSSVSMSASACSCPVQVCPIHSCPDPYNVCPEKLFITQECPEYIKQECPTQECPVKKCPVQDNTSWKIAVYTIGGILFLCIILVIILLLKKRKVSTNKE